MQRLSTIILTLLLSIGAMAQSETVSMGFCNGQMADEGDIQLNGKGWVSCATKLPSSALDAYKGNTISSIRAALLNRINIDTLKVWIRTNLDGDNIAEGYITRSSTPAVSKGWNEVGLTEPYEITENVGDIYIGYSFHQRANVVAVSIVGEPVAGTSYLKMGDAQWQDISNKGVISMEAIITGSSLPKQDLGLLSATISPWPQSGVNALKVNAAIHNYGIEAVNGFTIKCTTGETVCRTHIDMAIGPTSSTSCSFVIDPGIYTDSQAKWSIEIESIDNGTDENSTNNMVEAVCTYLKNVLIEEFTTEKCINCPRVAGYLHTAMNSSNDYSDRVFAVCHHAGYYTDEFTLPCDEEMLWLFNNGSNCYAPAMMINRQPYHETGNSAGSKTAVYLPQSPDDITSYINTEMELTANAVVGITYEFNTDSTTVTANVTCLKNDNLICAMPHLTVYLTEDEVKSLFQEGYEGQYYQQHVIRGYNSTWGEPVVWDGNSFTYSYTFDIDKAWKKNNMKIVAALANYNPDDATDCAVENSAAIDLIKKETTGINTAEDNNCNKPVEYFNLSGQRIANPQHGIFIVKYRNGKTSKILK